MSLCHLCLLPKSCTTHVCVCSLAVLISCSMAVMSLSTPLGRADICTLLICILQEQTKTPSHHHFYSLFAQTFNLLQPLTIVRQRCTLFSNDGDTKAPPPGQALLFLLCFYILSISFPPSYFFSLGESHCVKSRASNEFATFVLNCKKDYIW